MVMSAGLFDLSLQHELENWRIRIKKEEASNEKWEDWWGWMVDEKGGGEDTKKIVGNTKSMINTKDVPAPMFVTKEYLQSHYSSMLPGDKFETAPLESHKYGWRSKNAIVGLQTSLQQNFGRVNAR